MRKRFPNIILITALLIFCVYNFEKERYFEVLEIYSPNKIAIDLNKNKQVDNNEIFTFKVNTLSLKNEEEIFAYDYITKEFSTELLKNNFVKLNKNKSDIIINNQSYVQIFNNQDFSKINTENLRILNLKSNKYHHINCKYGKQSQNFIIVNKYNLPKDAKLCKYCKATKGEVKNLKTNNYEVDFVKTDSNHIKMIFTDFTTQLTSNNTCSTSLCKNIVKEINSAKTSIDMALYGYNDIPEIKNALIKAKNRGVKLRLVYDTNNNNYYQDTKILTKIVNNSKTDNTNIQFTRYLMHNKFFVVDNKTVITGSTNISPSGTSGYNSNLLLIINSKDIANLYTKEFEQMINGNFHQDKLKLIDKRTFTLGNSSIKVLFSPKDNIIVSEIIPIINNSKKSIQMPIFVLTHEQLTDTLIQAKHRGVNIKIILDATSANNKYSKHQTLRNNGILVKTENFAGKMHSKTMIVDEKYIITGSMNFSKNGESRNDENVLIIENTQLARSYSEFFNYIWYKIPNKWLTQDARAESLDSIGSCTDNVDNDFDGKIDKNDEGCK